MKPAPFLGRAVPCVAFVSLSIACRAGRTGGAHLDKGPVDGNGAHFFNQRDLAALAASDRSAWERYLENSEKVGAADRASMEAELRTKSQTGMTAAPYAKAFRIEARMTAEWFHEGEAAKMADSMLSFQTPSGGWSKHVEYGQGSRQAGQSYFSENTSWSYIATIDNDSTTEQMQFLAAAYRTRSEPRYRDAFLRGVDYLLLAQFPNGCWPQVFPLQGGYHDAATYNDDAIVNVMRLLGDVAHGTWDFVPPDKQREAAARIARGVRCIVASQVIVGGVRTVWAQQHHPITLAPVSARTYELVGLAGRESARVLLYLMEVPTPDPGVAEAIHAAADWLEKHRVLGYAYESDQVLKKADGTAPLWPRLTEIGTDRPIFSNRDGVKRYDWNELTDRRHGYAWFGKEPAPVLERYEKWAAEHPRAVAR